MSRPSVRSNRLSFSAVVMLFILGLLTLFFVDLLVGALILILSFALYLILLWLTSRFGRKIE